MEELRPEAESTLARFKQADPDIARLLDSATGYAVFRRIGKIGFILGGAGGTGLVYERGMVVGRARIAQFTVGAQIGGQVYAELVLFQDKAALERFKEGRIELSAQVSAVVAAEGVARTARYSEGC